MSSSHTEIPVEHQAPGRAKHHRTRYYAHRVKESFTSRVVKFICSVILGLLLVLGVIAFVLWLSLRPHRPRFHLEAFSLSLDNATVTFNATDRNPNQNVEIYYDEMAGSLFYHDEQMGSTETLLPAFHQPSKNTTFISGVFTATPSESWRQEFLAGGPVVFRLDLAVGIRFRVASWTTRHHRMHSSCDAGIGTDGQILAAYKDKRCYIFFD